MIQSDAGDRPVIGGFDRLCKMSLAIDASSLARIIISGELPKISPEPSMNFWNFWISGKNLMNKVDHFFDFLIIEVDQYRWMSGQFLFSSSNAILVILCDTTIEVYEDHLSKIQFRLAKVLLEMLHGDMLLDVGQGTSNLSRLLADR